jgi:hypothetical protein
MASPRDQLAAHERGWRICPALPPQRSNSRGKRQDAEEVAVFSGQHLVYVSCNWVKDTKKDIALKGCEEVLKSLRIEGSAIDA